MRVEFETSSAALIARTKSPATAPILSLAVLARVTKAMLFSSIVERTWFARRLKNSAELASFLSRSPRIFSAWRVSVFIRSSTNAVNGPGLPSTMLFINGSMMRRSKLALRARSTSQAMAKMIEVDRTKDAAPKAMRNSIGTSCVYKKYVRVASQSMDKTPAGQ